MTRRRHHVTIAAKARRDTRRDTRVDTRASRYKSRLGYKTIQLIDAIALLYISKRLLTSANDANLKKIKIKVGNMASNSMEEEMVPL